MSLSASVYAKTAKGIREIEQGRVKLPHDLSVVFDLVDARSTVAELLPRTELPTLKLYQALDMLAADGYIELVPRPAETTAPPEKGLAPDAPPFDPNSDTTERVRELNERVQVERRVRERSERQARRALTDYEASPYTWREPEKAEPLEPTATPDTLKNSRPGVDEALPAYVPTALERAMQRLAAAGEARPSTGSPESPSAATSGARRPAMDTGAANGRRPPPPDARLAPAPEPRLIQELQNPTRAAEAAHLAREGERARRKRFEDDARGARRSARQQRRLKRAFQVFAAVLVAIPALAVAWLQFGSLEHYVPAVANALSQRLGQPVRVGAVRYPLLPRPRLVIEDVSLVESQSMRANRLEARLLPWHALSATRRFEVVDVHGLAIDASALAFIPGWSAQANASALQVERLRFFDGKLNLPQVELAPLDGDIALTEGGGVREAVFTNAHVRLELMPQTDGVRVILNARDWRIPYAPAVEFSELVATGVVNRARGAAFDLRGRAAGGTVVAKLSADWPGAVAVTGRFVVQQARVEDLVTAFTQKVSARGILDSTGRFSMKAPAWAALTQSTQAEGRFSISRGELANIDLIRALQSDSGGELRGGRTAFDSLTGTFHLARAEYRYRDLRLVSGPLNAAGSLTVAGDGALSGRLTAELGSGRGVVARSALALTGSLQNPQLKR